MKPSRHFLRRNGISILLLLLTTTILCVPSCISYTTPDTGAPEQGYTLQEIRNYSVQSATFLIGGHEYVFIQIQNGHPAGFNHTGTVLHSADCPVPGCPYHNTETNLN